MPNNVASQDAALESILDAISSWEKSRKLGSNGPLVLAIVGPNGVGKSETGDILINCKIIFMMHYQTTCDPSEMKAVTDHQEEFNAKCI